MCEGRREKRVIPDNTESRKNFDGGHYFGGCCYYYYWGELFWTPAREACLARVIYSVGVGIAFDVSGLSQHRDLN